MIGNTGRRLALNRNNIRTKFHFIYQENQFASSPSQRTSTLIKQLFRRNSSISLRQIQFRHRHSLAPATSSLVSISEKSHSHHGDGNLLPSLVAAAAGLVFASSVTLANKVSSSSDEMCAAEAQQENHPSPTVQNVGSDRNFEDSAPSLEDLPEYTSDDVAKNDGKSGKPIWMSYGGVVYDVTDFIANHPGGSERILMAAGSAIEPFWHYYRQHFASDLPMRLMEKLVIGRLADKDQEAIDAKMEKLIEENEDPYIHEPRRNPQLLVHSDEPMNAEVPAELITESYLTPAELFYIRHHHPVPLLSAEEAKSFELEVDLSVLMDQGKDSNGKRKISINDIKQLPKVEVVTTLQCSGNRRGDMNKVQRTSGTSWGQGAVSTAKWGGARLVDILQLAGIDDPVATADQNDGEKHVRFEGLDGVKASIGMEKAVNPFGDVIVAYEMNGEALPRDHGFPLRVIVPGYSAKRNLKWLKKIELDLTKVPSMNEVSLFSGITEMECLVCRRPDPTDTNKEVLIKAKGWAWAGGGRNIVRVDVTGDGGKSWVTANITKGGDQKFGRAWAWVFWECEVPARVSDDGTVELASKAVDHAFNVQPQNVAHGWNVRGLGNNSWYRVTRKVSEMK